MSFGKARCWWRGNLLGVGLVLAALMGGLARAEVGSLPASGSTLIVSGSKSLEPIVEQWGRDLGAEVPGFALRLQATGSETAAAALADGAADLAAMSRAMDAVEIQSFETRKGFKPTAVRVALDAVTIVVNELNPLRGLTMAQVDAIFSVSRRCGGDRDVTVWGQLEEAGIWHSRPLQLFGLDALSGTRRYLREHALCGGEFKSEVASRRAPGEVVEAVRDSTNAIGYVPMAFYGKGVKALSLMSEASGELAAPVAENIVNGTYPLSRHLYLYVAIPPRQPLPGLVKRFLALVLSPQGQRRVAEIGYVPLPSAVIAQELAKLH